MRQAVLVAIGLLTLMLSGCQSGAAPVTAEAASPAPSKSVATTPVAAAEEEFVASGPIVVEN